MSDIIEKTIKQAFEEDIATGDVTTLATIPESQVATAEFLAKDSGVIAGLDITQKIFELLNPKIIFEAFVTNGTWVDKGKIIAKVSGPAGSILTAERTALNFLQRMSGIATATKKYVDAVAGTKAIILDTRKTVPGLRIFDKMAVAQGGGQNHRIGLFDMFLIKDNHIAAAGSITKAITTCKSANKNNIKIEVEVKNFDELREALSLSPDRIMLDNMTLDQMAEAVKIVNGAISLEASGGVNLDTVKDIASTGVDYISVGALTHSVKAFDISLNIV